MKHIGYVRGTVLVTVCAFSVTLVRQSDAQTMIMRSESFDSDPLWDGHNNRLEQSRQITQDFGYSSNSNNAGGDSSGEIGGRITPAGEAAYYATTIPVATFNDSLVASGRLNLRERGHTLLGFFNADDTNEWRTPNSISLRLIGRNDTFFFAFADYATSQWRAGGNVFSQPGGGEFEFDSGPGDFHDWRLEYDPLGNSGGGRIIATIDNQSVVTNLDPGHKTDGATFNRFGLLNVMKSADDHGQLWVDDLTINGVADEFDSNPSWEGLNNRNTYTTTNIRPSFDFGFTPTNLAGGQGAGEIGGSLFRGDSRLQFNGGRLAYYGDSLDETLTLEQPLMASGRVAMHRGVTDSTTLIGFFNSTESIRNSDSQISGIPENFVGAAIEGPSAEGFYWYPAYGVNQEGVRPSGNRGSPTPPYIYPDGQSREWTIQYNPNAAAGRGAVVVALDGQAVTLNLDLGHKQIGAEFDRFGIITTHIDGNGQTVYFDDLSYTVGFDPEPVIEWAEDVSGDAAVANSWFPAVTPNSNNSNVVLGNAITQSRVLYADSQLTMKSLTFNNPNSYILAGQGSVNLEADLGDAQLAVLDGSHQFQIPVQLGSDLEVNLPAGTMLTFNNGLFLNGFELHKSGAGQLVINNELRLDGGSITGSVTGNAVEIPEPSKFFLFCCVVLFMNWLRSRNQVTSASCV